MKIAFHHIALPVHNLALAQDFYCEILGFEVLTRPEGLPAEGVWLIGAGVQLHLIKSTVPKTTTAVNKRLPSPNHAAFSTQNISEFRDDLLKKGVVVGDLIKINTNFYQFFFQDPSGNNLEINSLKN